MLLFVITAAGVADLAVLMTLIFLAFTWLGLVIPLTMVLALEQHGRIAGMASALGGTLQMLTGAAIIVAVSLFFNGTALPMVTTIALRAVHLACRKNGCETSGMERRHQRLCRRAKICCG